MPSCKAGKHFSLRSAYKSSSSLAKILKLFASEDEEGPGPRKSRPPSNQLPNYAREYQEEDKLSLQSETRNDGRRPWAEIVWRKGLSMADRRLWSRGIGPSEHKTSKSPTLQVILLTSRLFSCLFSGLRRPDLKMHWRIQKRLDLFSSLRRPENRWENSSSFHWTNGLGSVFPFCIEARADGRATTADRQAQGRKSWFVTAVF